MNEPKHGSAIALQGSYLTPSFEHARVADAMRPGVITCPPDATMGTVARIMAAEHVHSVVVTGLEGDRPWGVVGDRDLLASARDAHDKPASWCANTEIVSVLPGDTLEAAVDLMQAHGVTHLLVGDPASGPPIGVLSSLDVAGIVAWGRG
jgi:CBS domain-containing protein